MKDPKKRKAPRPKTARPDPAALPPTLDRVIHERVRLGIVSALAARGAMTHNELKAVLGTSHGNLSVHARKLEEAGFVACTKSFDDRTPRTEYELTTAGREALAAYLDQMERVIAAARSGA